MRHSRETKSLIFTFLWVFFLILPLIIFLVDLSMGGYNLRWEWYQPIAFLSWGAAWLMYVQSRKLSAPPANEILEKDNRPPILYLRSFRSDIFDAWRRNLQAIFMSKNEPGATTEEKVTEALGALGPVVALGRPGEKLPELGAARMYAADEEWQNTVRRMLDRCQLVLIRAGRSPGLRWELKEIVDTVNPRQVILFFPGKRSFRKFRKWADHIFPVSLPGVWPNDLMGFDDHWRPDIPLTLLHRMRSRVNRKDVPVHDLIITNFEGDHPGNPEDLHKGFTLRELAEAGTLRKMISAHQAQTDWSDPEWGVLDTNRWSIEFALPKKGMVFTLPLHVKGEGEPLEVVRQLCFANGWTAYNYTTGKWVKKGVKKGTAQ
jgi:hypothetical protein